MASPSHVEAATAAPAAPAASAAPAALQRRGHIEEVDVQQALAEEAPVVAEAVAVPALTPQVNDRIMVVREPWLDLILSNTKTMEIRGCKARPGLVWVATKGRIHGHVDITKSIDMSPEEFATRRAEHHWPEGRGLPYEKLCGLLLANPSRLPAPIDYWRPPSAIGWNVFRKGPEDWPMKGKGSQAAKKKQASDEAKNGDGEKSKTKKSQNKKKGKKPARAAA